MNDPAINAEKASRRDTILDVAKECFIADGYSGTSMSTIAARLGGSKGTLYNYFKSKEELFVAVLRRSSARLQSQLDSRPPAGDLRLHLIDLASRYLDHVLSPEPIAFHRLVVGEGGRFPEMARLFYDVGPKVGMTRNAELFGALMDAGRLRRADPSLAAQHFFGLVLSSALFERLWGVMEESSVDAQAMQFDLAVDAFLRAYAPTETDGAPEPNGRAHSVSQSVGPGG